MGYKGSRKLDVYKRQVSSEETETTKYYNMGATVLNEVSSNDGNTTNLIGAGTVSYTHLDVYKRQVSVILVSAILIGATGNVYGYYSQEAVSYTHLKSVVKYDIKGDELKCGR